MGLAGPKKRAKLSHDPNNTAWSRNTESFGHKILSSQGWTPGDTLGAKDAAHSSHYTAGSNSHIRVLLKDDQLGLGAKSGGNNAETFGLSLFSGILGRLNGKSEVQLEKEQMAQRDVELALYQSRKGRYVNFVSAGFLVGDRIENAQLLNKEEAKKAKVVGIVKETEKPLDSDSQGTKRKRLEAEAEADVSSDSASSSEDDDAPAPKPTKSKKSKKSSDSTKAKKSKKSKKDTTTEESDSVAAPKKSKKDKKSKSSDLSSSEDDDRAAKKARKAERQVRREERRKRKEAKKAAKSASATPSTTAPGTPAEPASGSATPQATPFIGRHAVRQRYIAAKGRAHLDPQALKEIFMVKA